MAELRRPDIALFEREKLPTRTCNRLLTYEERGVLEDMVQALKQMRSCVFLCSDHVLTDADVAKVSGIHTDILQRVLPKLHLLGFVMRDDNGALFSTQLYVALLKREERRARKAQADAQWQEAQREGDIPCGVTRRQFVNRQNAKMAGRPRKSEDSQSAYDRRLREKEQQHAQRNIPLMQVYSGGEIENRNTKSNDVSISIDLESERDNNIPSSSISGEIEKPKTKLDDVLVRKVAARVMSVSGMTDQASFAVSLARRWLGLGATEETIISAVQEQQAAIRKNGEEPRRLKVFEAAVLRGIEAQSVSTSVPQSTAPEAAKTREMRQCEDAWMRAQQVFAEAFEEHRDFGVVTRRWKELAQQHGLPDLPHDYRAYQQHFCGRDAAA